MSHIIRIYLKYGLSKLQAESTESIIFHVPFFRVFLYQYPDPYYKDVFWSTKFFFSTSYTSYIQRVAHTQI